MCQNRDLPREMGGARLVSRKTTQSTNAHVLDNIYIYIYVCIQTHSHTFTHIHTHSHTHIHIYIYIYI